MVTFRLKALRFICCDEMFAELLRMSKTFGPFLLLLSWKEKQMTSIFLLFTMTSWNKFLDLEEGFMGLESIVLLSMKEGGHF